jgi:hypothetical protein
MKDKFELTHELNKAEFQFVSSFDFISIKRITAKSLMKKKHQEWFDSLSDLFLLFTSNSIKGSIHSFKIGLSDDISLDHKFPVYDYSNFIVPEENKNNLTAVGDYVTQLTIELKSNKGDLLDTELLFECEYTPGAKKIG